MISARDEAVSEFRQALLEGDATRQLERYARAMRLMHDTVFLAGDAAVEPGVAFETVYLIVFEALGRLSRDNLMGAESVCAEVCA